MREKSAIVVMILLLLSAFALLGVRGIRAQESGWALHFDGQTDFVELDYTADMLPEGWQETKTVSLWMKPEGPGEPCGRDDPAGCSAVFGDRPRWWGISRGVRAGQDRIWVWNAGTLAAGQYSLLHRGVL